VTPEAVASVNAAVEQLHYVPNRAARSLVRRRAQTIAMVIPQRTAEFFADPYFAEVIQGAAMYASSTDYTLTLLIESDVDPDKTRRFLTGGNVDGALVLSHHTSMQAYAKLSASLPVVFGVRGLEPADPPGHVVDVDNVEAGALATQRLVTSRRSPVRSTPRPASTVWPGGDAHWVPQASSRGSRRRATSRRRVVPGRWSGCWPTGDRSTRCSRPPRRWRRGRSGCCATVGSRCLCGSR
jgi:hypothetical protein